MQARTILVLLAVCGAVGGCLRRNGKTQQIEVFAPMEITVTTHLAKTGDGVTLALHRHTSATPRKGSTVLLCHSMGFHSGVWAIDGLSALADSLAENGYDVWRLDFRGCGLSGRAPDNTTLDDYGAKDIPAAIETIAHEAKKPDVFVIGHGAGGSAALIYLLSAAKPMVSGLILIGAPLTGPLPRDAIFSDLSLAEKCLVDPAARFPSITCNLPETPPKGWESLFYNPSNITPHVRDALLRQCAEPIPKGVADQFLRMIETGKLTSLDGKRSYLDECSAIRLPIYAICGKGDNLAPPSTARAIFHRVASVDKTFRLFCRANGDGEDFGNLDLICGKKVESVVFPEIENWLRERSGT